MTIPPKVGDRVRVVESDMPRHVGQICVVERVLDYGVMVRIPEANPFLYHPNDNLWYFDFDFVEPYRVEKEMKTS